MPRMKKVYGQSQDTTCIFCEKQATTQNAQGLPVCKDHANKQLEDIRCTCGEYLDIKQSKWGPFFLCASCGTISLSKGLSLREDPNQDTNTGYKLNKKFRKETKSTKPIEYDQKRVYTIEELQALWDK